ncbi:tripartite tricarboxylate transporter substrate binding protein [Falsiroseomonas sp. HW251]|uniref:tripartite tricarboxylate transporter substrate binding protein n=1 Tax=Falsiroseomonas sp. HW251 TaxID=3390998 RepID=UPI003D323002
MMLRRSLLLAALARPALAQTRAWSPPTRMIIPYGAGNITDVVARVLLDVIGPRHGWRTAADNQPGAGGMMGANNLIRATPDGSVFGVVSAAALTILPHIQRPRFDPFPELQPITGLTISHSFLAVNAQVPVRTLDELVAYARSRPKDDPLNYPSPGAGTVPHINLVALSHALDFPLQHVPYRTSAAGNTDLLANRVQVTMDSFALTLQYMRDGRLTPIAFNGPQRHPLLPDVPTFAEAAPQVQLTNSWQGLFFPKATPAAITERAAAELRDTVTSHAFIERLPPGATPFALPPDELARQVASESARIGRLAAEINLTID